MRKYIEFITVILLLGFAVGWYAYKQPQLQVAEGKGWDGVTYHKMYQHFKGTSSDTIFDFPFNKRVGLPWLAAHLPIEETKAFLFINLTAGCFTAFFTYITLRGRCSNIALFACLAPLLCYVYSPIRFPNFYPHMVDPPAMMLYALAAYLLSREKYLPSVLVLTISTLFREVGVYYALGLAVVLLCRGDFPRLKAWGITLIALSGVVLVWIFQLPGTQGSQSVTIISLALRKLLDPAELVRVVACISLTLAPFIIFLTRATLSPRASIGPAESFGVMALSLSLAMCAVGGGDTTRILFNGYPLFVIILVEWLRGAPPLRVGLAALAGMVANRFRVVIQEPLSGLPSYDIVGYFSMTPDYAPISLSVVTLAYWVIVWFILFGPGWDVLKESMRHSRRLSALCEKS